MYCRVETPIEYYSPMPILSLDGRLCPKCGKAFVIENGFAKRLKKPAQKARSQKAGL
jgi:hypothetical protein